MLPPTVAGWLAGWLCACVRVCVCALSLPPCTQLGGRDGDGWGRVCLRERASLACACCARVHVRARDCGVRTRTGEVEVEQRRVGLEPLRERDNPKVVNPVEAQVELGQRGVRRQQLADARRA